MKFAFFIHNVYNLLFVRRNEVVKKETERLNYDQTVELGPTSSNEHPSVLLCIERIHKKILSPNNKWLLEKILIDYIGSRLKVIASFLLVPGQEPKCFMCCQPNPILKNFTHKL